MIPLENGMLIKKKFKFPKSKCLDPQMFWDLRRKEISKMDNGHIRGCGELEAE